MNKLSLLAVSLLFVMTACVKKTDFEALQADKSLMETALEKTKGELTTCNDEKTTLLGNIVDLESTVASQISTISGKDAQIKTLEGNITAEKAKRGTIFSTLSDLSIMSESDAKQFSAALDNIHDMPEGERNTAFTKALTENLTNYLGEAEKQGVEISSKGGAVLLSLSDKVLYDAGRFNLTEEAKTILDAVAKVIQANASIAVLIEGHTDADPIQFTKNKNNWDLSVKRAMKVADYLEKAAEIAPTRLVVAGRGEYAPKADNATEEGKAMNRRTEIMLVPGLNDYFRLVAGK